MIQGENISLKLGSKMILRNINLTISPGDYVVLLGPNGAGKSTLLKVLSRLQKPSAGRVMLNGQLGFLSHRSFLYDRLTAWENLKFYGNLFQVSNLADRIERIIDQVGLSYFLHDPVDTYSRGMVQRLAIARAVLHDPEILFLDEPFTGLDQKGAAILKDVLTQMHRQRKTIVIVTHDFNQGMDLVDRVLIMKGGAKIFDDKITQSGAQDIRNIYHEQVGME
ncbi:MAG: ABC transporter ATP-binding protein [Dehalobacterium sp.]